MNMRVTFDTNTLADVVSPAESQRPTGAVNGAVVRAAILDGAVQGYFCETLVVLEGIKNADRRAVFGSTEPNTRYRHGIAPDGNGMTMIDISVEQPARRPLDQRQARRFLAAFELGMKLLAATRTGMARVDDPDDSRYVAELGDGQLCRRLDRHFEVVTAIEARGVGCAQAQRIADEISKEVGGIGSFVSYLGKPRTLSEQHEINRAIAEWADGDSIAAHYAYDADVFCTEDFAKSAMKPSVFDAENREWLMNKFGIRFATLGELARMIER